MIDPALQLAALVVLAVGGVVMIRPGPGSRPAPVPRRRAKTVVCAVDQARLTSVGGGPDRATGTVVGGGPRAYAARGRERLDGYSADEMCGRTASATTVTSSRGLQQQLPLIEPEKQNAIHGLARWANWTVAERPADSVMMEVPAFTHSLVIHMRCG